MYCLPYVERTLRCIASFEDKSSFVHSFDEDVHNRMIHVLTGAVGAELVLKEKLADREKKCEDLQRQIQETKAAITEKRDANIKRKEAIQLAKDTVEELNRTMQTLNITQDFGLLDCGSEHVTDTASEVSLHQHHLEGSIVILFSIFRVSHWGQCEVQVWGGG
ncbi:hypothetical protein HanRHA438_Chr14g0632381 [Helianthus annuus]|nr:hypothetical protein HanRHA438_Chr14g0632381 [Helianthus annuus]